MRLSVHASRGDDTPDRGKRTPAESASECGPLGSKQGLEPGPSLEPREFVIHAIGCRASQTDWKHSAAGWLWFAAWKGGCGYDWPPHNDRANHATKWGPVIVEPAGLKVRPGFPIVPTRGTEVEIDFQIFAR
jgi:hypothetical protein